jgi:hypothetical protein
MKLIESKTLGTAAASIEFTSIPQTPYTDLVLFLSLRGNSPYTYDQPRARINGSTTGYSARSLYGDGTSAGSENLTSQTSLKLGVQVGGASTANTFGNGYTYFPNAFGSTTKSTSSDDVGENNATLVYMALYSNLWTGTDAISSLLIFPETGSQWVAGSTASLYGITKGSDGIVTTSP